MFVKTLISDFNNLKIRYIILTNMGITFSFTLHRLNFADVKIFYKKFIVKNLYSKRTIKYLFISLT